jgi:sulfofructosephosphate aldolase
MPRSGDLAKLGTMCDYTHVIRSASHRFSFAIYQPSVLEVLNSSCLDDAGAICDYSHIMLTNDTGHAAGPLRLPEGGYAMVALDQRQSLRNLHAETGQPDDDDAIAAFKQSAVAVLSEHASAVLLDRELGLRGGAPRLAPGCALVVAADQFVQPPGRPVESTDLDPDVTAEYAAGLGAAALKFLVIWKPDRGRAGRDDVVGRFLEVSRQAGAASVLEGIVRPPAGRGWRSQSEHDDGILAAAAEFAAARPTIYKTEVPGLGTLPAAELTRRAREITSTLSSPWVVLSSGVPPAGFPAAVEAACAGGAEGFLAGRAIWAGSIAAADPAADLRVNAVARLEALRQAVAAGRGQRA